VQKRSSCLPCSAAPFFSTGRRNFPHPWRHKSPAGFPLRLPPCAPAGRPPGAPRQQWDSFSPSSSAILLGHVRSLAPAPSVDSLPSHGAELFPSTLAASERRAPYARVPCISLLASSTEHAGAGTPWRPLPWPELEQPVFFPNAGTQSSFGCGLPVPRASTSLGRPRDSPAHQRSPSVFPRGALPLHPGSRLCLRARNDQARLYNSLDAGAPKAAPSVFPSSLNPLRVGWMPVGLPHG
jgi:hypothetical protein